MTSAFSLSITTLKREAGTPQTWRRLLGDSAYVEFNSAGQHMKTVNALGWTTSFAYTGGLLEFITLPVPQASSEVRRYRFWYTSSLLDSVQAPNASLSRTTRVARAGTPRINSITDPDGVATAFGYDASNRITTRRNKLNDTTYFQYDDGSALKQSKLSTARTDGASSAITTNFKAAETRSAYNTTDGPSVPGMVYTQIDGPRTDVGDTTNIIVNRWGAPDSVTNALGQLTRVTRGNAAFPALATKVVGANGLETRAFFNSRGLPDSTVAVEPFNTGENATTKYGWNPVWNQPDSVIHPADNRTRTFYRTSRPIVDSMRIGSNAARRVKFTYTADNQVRAVTEPGLWPDSVIYDALGNTSRTWTPMGRAALPTPYFTEFMKDAIGRDTLLLTPDTTGRTRITYDAADRVIRTKTDGLTRPYSLPLSPGFPPDTAIVVALLRTDSSAYDAEGNLVFKRALSSGGDVQFNKNLKHDAAGRLRKRSVGTGPDSMVYDPAGNLINAKHRSGAWVTQSYDVLNRLTTRVIPEITHVKQTCQGFATPPLGDTCQMVFPYYPNSGENLRIAADTARFIYDSFGNMTQANNRYARIWRTYYPGGALKTDSTGIGGNSNPLVNAAKSGQLYTYDISGRRIQMEWGLGPTSYTYNDFGGLNTVTSLNGIQHRFVYTLSGQVDSLLQGTGVREKRWYDDDGRRTLRIRNSDVLGLLVRDSLSYDKMSRITRARQQVRQQSPDSTFISYDGLGAVVAKEQGGEFGSSVEEFRNDAFGNVLRRLTRRTAGLINNAPFAMSYAFKGELTAVNAQLPSPPEGSYQRQDDLTQGFLSGRMTRQGQIVRNHNDGNVEHQVAARHYFGADDRLMAVQRYSYRSTAFRDGTWEEYRYDALGRRVATRARRESQAPPGSGALCLSTATPVCRSYTERVWWDGDTDQALFEHRGPEGTSDVSNDDRLLKEQEKIP